MMEIHLRAALIDWLRADPALAAINVIAEEAPLAASMPWIGIVASASTDWSTKDRLGREVRVAIELNHRGDAAGTSADLAAAIEARLATLPAQQTGFTVVTRRFERARAERRASNTRALLVEYRFRLLAD